MLQFGKLEVLLGLNLTRFLSHNAHSQQISCLPLSPSSALPPSYSSVGPSPVLAAASPGWALLKPHQAVGFLGPELSFLLHSPGLPQKQSPKMMSSNGQRTTWLSEVLRKGVTFAQAWSQVPVPGRFKQSCTAKVVLLNILFLVPKFTRLTFCKYFFQHGLPAWKHLDCYLSKFISATKRSKRLINPQTNMIPTVK